LRQSDHLRFHHRSDEKAESEGSVMMNDINDELILAARLLLATLFLIFGWRKVRDYSGTVSQMVQVGLPTPVLATVVSIVMELPVAFAVALGIFTRPSAALMAPFQVRSATVQHRQHGGVNGRGKGRGQGL
jgi:putative oxidoreductase